MYKFGLATKIEENLYEIFNILTVPDALTEVINRIDDVVNSQKPIVSMKTSQFKEKATIGAIWNGSDFTESNDQWANANWDVSDTYSLLCENKIFFQMITIKNTVGHDMHDAAFENDVTLVKINDNDNVNVGDHWDTEKIIKVV